MRPRPPPTYEAIAANLVLVGLYRDLSPNLGEVWPLLSSDWLTAPHSVLWLVLRWTLTTHFLCLTFPRVITCECLCLSVFFFNTFGDNYLRRGIKLMNRSIAAYVLPLQHNDWTRGIPLSYYSVLTASCAVTASCCLFWDEIRPQLVAYDA